MLGNIGHLFVKCMFFSFFLNTFYYISLDFSDLPDMTVEYINLSVL